MGPTGDFVEGPLAVMSASVWQSSDHARVRSLDSSRQGPTIVTPWGDWFPRDANERTSLMRTIRRLLVAAGLVTALLGVGSGSVAAEHHPFCGSGEEFADEHIVALAQAGVIGPEQGGGIHNPGSHQGFFTCLHR